LIPELNTAIDSLSAEAIETQYFEKDNMAPEKIPEILAALDGKMDLFKQYEETSERYNDWQVKLYVPQTNFDNLDELRVQLTNRHLMWHSLADWNSMQADWMDTQFGQIDADNIKKTAEKYSKICKRLEGAIDPNPIQMKLKNLVEQFEQAMPIVMALRNPDL
jgi:dynein heavy chain